jgi:hypothetical protein
MCVCVGGGGGGVPIRRKIFTPERIAGDRRSRVVSQPLENRTLLVRVTLLNLSFVAVEVDKRSVNIQSG